MQEAFRITGIHPFSPSIISSLKQTLRKESIEPEWPAHENCLVEMGRIPASLAEILVPPPSKPSNKKGKFLLLNPSPLHLMKPSINLQKAENFMKEAPLMSNSPHLPLKSAFPQGLTRQRNQLALFQRCLRKCSLMSILMLVSVLFV